MESEEVNRSRGSGGTNMVKIVGCPQASLKVDTGISSNATDLDLWPLERKAIVCSVLSVIILFTTLGNLVTIIAVKKDKRLQNISSFYIASLAAADLVVGSVVMTWMMMYSVVFDGVWIFGTIFCDIWQCIDYTACCASLTNVCMIAYDRYLAVSKPLKTMHSRTKKRARVMIFLAWLVPAVYWITILMFMRWKNGYSPPNTCQLIWDPGYVVIIATVPGILLPISVIICLFIKIMSVLRKHSHQMNIRMRSIRSTMATDRPSLRRMRNNYVTAQITTSYSANKFNPFAVKVNRRKLDSVYSQSTSEGQTGTECDMSSSSSDTGSEKDNTFVTDATCGKNLPGPDGVIPIFRTGMVAYAGDNAVETVVATEPPELDGQHLVDDHESTDDENDEDSDSNKTEKSGQGGLSRDTERRFSGRRVSSVDGSLVTSCLLAPRGSCISDDMVMRKSMSVFTLPRRSDPGPLSPPPGSKQPKQAYGEYLKSERYTYLERMRLNKQIKAAKTLGVIMAFLLFCWLPYSIMWPLQAYCNNCIFKRIYDIAIWINYFNSSVNPIIYCMCNQSFRRAYARLFTNR
jgi:hypothetical protein